MVVVDVGKMTGADVEVGSGPSITVVMVFTTITSS